MGTKAYFYQEDFSGGLSDSDIVGPESAFAEGVGVDIHTKPGSISVHQKLTKNSGTTVTELCKHAVRGSDGNDYWFSSESGKVWKRTSAGVWSLLFTNTRGACIGACEFNDYIYYATNDDLGRFGTLSSGSPTNSDGWAALVDTSWHPMTVCGLYLCIGNKRSIATVDDAGTFTANGNPSIEFANLPWVHSIRALTRFGSNILFGTETSDSYARTIVGQWDLSSPTFLSDPPDIPNFTTKAIISKGMYAYVITGLQGDIYYYDGKLCTKLKKIPGTYSDTQYLDIFPASNGDFAGRTLFGVSNGTGNSCLQGVYSIGQHDKNYPVALTLDYPISTGETSGIGVGAILVSGETSLYVSWKNGTTAGIDLIDWSNKYASAYFKTMQLIGDRTTSKVFENYVLSYASKPTDTALALSYAKNFGTSFTSIPLNDRTDNYKYFQKNNIPTGVIQFKVDFTTKTNNAPQLDSLYTDWTEEKIK